MSDRSEWRKVRKEIIEGINARSAKMKIAIGKLEEILSSGMIMDKTGEVNVNTIDMNDGPANVPYAPMSKPSKQEIKPKFSKDEDVIFNYKNKEMLGTIYSCYSNGFECFYVVEYSVEYTGGAGNKLIHTEYLKAKVHERDVFTKVF